jgi:hypothetical protein
MLARLAGTDRRRPPARDRQQSRTQLALSLAHRSSPWTRLPAAAAAAADGPIICLLPCPPRRAVGRLSTSAALITSRPPQSGAGQVPPPRCDGRSREQSRAEERDGVAGHEASAWWGAGREKRVDGEIIQSVSPSLSTKPFPPSFLPSALSLSLSRRAEAEADRAVCQSHVVNQPERGQ